MASNMAVFSEAEINFEATNWSSAREAFQRKGHDKKRVAEFLKSYETAQSAKAGCIETQNKAGHKYAKGIGGILSKIETFMKVGDLAIKSAPESVGLAWMGIRLCLHSVEDDFAVFNLFSAAAADIVGILISCRVYGRMFGGHKGPEEFQELHAKVVEYIPTIYSEILDFSYAMKKHMDKKGGLRIIKGLFSSALNEFQPKIESIKEAEKIMSTYASKATDQLSIHYQETGLRNQEIDLKNQEGMMADLSLIKNTLEASMRTMKKKTPYDKARDLFDANCARLSTKGTPQNTLERNLKRREKDTCNWIFELEEYKTWRESSESGLLWITGVGGLGKSILMSSVIDRLQTDARKDRSSAVQFCFCTDDATRVSSKIMAQTLHQLYVLSASEESPDLLDKANDVISKYLGPKDDAKSTTQSRSDKAIGFDEAYSSLAEVLEKRVLLVIDAVDECTDRKESQLLKVLQKMLHTPDAHVKILLCSRPDSDIVDEMAERTQIRVEDHNGPDLERAAQSKLETLPGLSNFERDLACKAIVEKAKGLFRCVDPAIDFLRKPWQRPIEKRLQQLPDGLDNSYQQILRQTDPDYLQLLQVALRWCIFGKYNPLVAEVMDEYSCAYTEGIDGSDENPYDNMDDPLVSDQIRMAGSNTFLQVQGNEVSIRHMTVKDFFLKLTPPERDTGKPCGDVLCSNCKGKAAIDVPFHLSPKEAHLQMALTIFKHLNSPLFQRRYIFKADASDSSGSDSESSEGSRDTAATDPDIANEPVTGDNLEKTGSADEGLNQSEEPQTNDSEHGINASNEDPGVPDEEPAAVEEEKPLTEDPNYDPFADNDDAHTNIATEDAASEIISNTNGVDRYELQQWQYHLHEAETLWSSEERESSQDWKELWSLVMNFMCNSPRAFRIWSHSFFENPEWPWFYLGKDVDPSPLDIATLYGLTGLAEKLIERGESPKKELKDGRQALWFAAGNNVKLLNLLLVNGASLNSHTEFPPAFHRLMGLNPTLDAVKLIVQNGVDCTILDSWGLNVMHHFVWAGSEVEILDLLLQHGADINIKDNSGETPLHHLLSRSEIPLDLLRAMLDKGADVNIDDKESQRPLYEVSMVGNTEAAKILLDHGADISDEDAYGMTALHAAAYQGNLDTVKLLVEQGAAINDINKAGRTAFYFACQEGHLETTRFLLSVLREQGESDINKAMKDGRTPLSKAAGRGHLDIVKMLLNEPDIKATVNVRETEQLRTSLHRASCNGKTDVVNQLLCEGADATILDADGCTALALCGRGWAKDKSGDWEPILLALVDHDLDTAVKDAALMATAAIKGSMSVLQRLLDAKAPPNRQDEHGWTPLQLAQQYGNTEAATLLTKRGAEVGSRPSKWVTKHEKIQILEDGLDLEFIGEASNLTVLTNHPIPAGIERYYYEIKIGEVGENSNLFNAIGFSTQPARLDRMPGWYNAAAPSWGYHGDDGHLFANASSSTLEYGGTYGKGDTIGCGVVYHEGIDGVIFYTRNGEPQGIAFDKDVRGRLYPAVGMAEPAALKANFGLDVDHRPFLWKMANEGKWGVDDIKAKVEEEVVAVAVDDGKVAVPAGVIT